MKTKTIIAAALILAAVPITSTVTKAADGDDVAEIWSVWKLGSSTGKPIIGCLALDDLREVQRLRKTAYGNIAVDRFIKTKMTVRGGVEMQSCSWLQSGETFSSAKKQIVDDTPYFCMELLDYSGGSSTKKEEHCIWVRAIQN